MYRRKRTFLYRIVNDDLEISKQTILRLARVLYKEEIFGENTAEVNPEPPEHEQSEESAAVSEGSSRKRLLVVASVVGIMATSIYLYKNS